MKQLHTDLGKDPRTMVTPKAFTIAESVLYTPLATPFKRAVAMLIDGLLITILAEQMDWLFVLLVVGIIYVEKRSRQFGRLLKWGLYAAMLGLMLFSSAGSLWDFHLAKKSPPPASAVNEISGFAVIIPALVSLGLCDDAGCAREQISVLKQNIKEVQPTQVSPIERRDMVLETLDNSGLSTADKATLRTEILNGTLWPMVDTSEVKVLMTPPKATISSQTPHSATLVSPTLKSEQQDDGMVGEKSNAQIARAQTALSQPELSQSELSQPELNQAKLTLVPFSDKDNSDDEGDSHSVLAWIKGFMSDMGLGFGWAAFYFTVFTAKFDGQTLGKKLLGIRVIQLDGAKISLWTAFGRYGGYAAGFTTGLLGFIQIFWDANRQGIQDKISSTVVIDLAQMHKKQQLEQHQALVEPEFSVVSTLNNAPSAHLTTSTRSEQL